MTGPKRIQRKRVKGWRMPEGAVYVGRGTEWGNPWRVGTTVRTEAPTGVLGVYRCQELPITADLAVALYRAAFTPDAEQARAEKVHLQTLRDYQAAHPLLAQPTLVEES